MPFRPINKKRQIQIKKSTFYYQKKKKLNKSHNTDLKKKCAVKFLSYFFLLGMIYHASKSLQNISSLAISSQSIIHICTQDNTPG